MSTDDRSEIYREQCPCGKDEIIIILCTPDHHWARPNQRSFETTIACEICRSKYELIEQRNTYSLVEKPELAKKNAYWSEYQSRSKKLLDLPETLEILKIFEDFLEEQRTAAARYRILREHRIINESIGTFRKKWKSANDWVKKVVGVSDLFTIMKILGKKEPKISTEIDELNALYGKYKSPIPIVGEPLIKI